MRIMLTWIIASILTMILVSFIIGATTPDVEQLPLTFVAQTVPVIIYVTLGLAIITVPFYRHWVKKHWMVNLTFIILCSLVIRANSVEQNEPNYSSETKILRVNGKDYTKTVEYYYLDTVHEKIRSISYTLNDLKDSIWTTYAEDGKIIKQEIYKNDALVQKIK